MRRGLFLLSYCLAAGAPVVAQHVPGFVWNRKADFVSGVVPGTNFNAGNPCPDSTGAIVWSSECAIDGGSLIDPEPWYTRSTALLTWDSAFNGMFAAWTAGDDKAPPIQRDFHLHYRTDADSLSRTPIVRWTSPVPGGATIDIDGFLRLTWGGIFSTSDVEVDVVIALAPAVGAPTPLLAQTHTKPTPNDMTESMAIDVALHGVALSAGDSIIFSARARATAPDPTHYIGILDETIFITLSALADCPTDINGDGLVDFTDLNAILGQFNQPCP